MAEQVLDAKYLNHYEAKRLEIIKTMIPNAPPGDKALDLGCGSGMISRLLTDRGWAVTAVDLDPGNVERARSRVESVIHGDALSVCQSLAPSTFGLIAAFELIEHVQKSEGEAILRACAGLCKPRGSLLVSTPNRMSPEGAYGYYYAELIRGRRWTAWDSTHQHIYSSSEILQTIKRTGWEPREIVGYHYGGRISLPLESSQRFPLNRLGFNILIRATAR